MARSAARGTARRMECAPAILALAASLLGMPLAGEAGALTPSFALPPAPLDLADIGGRSAPDLADIDGDGDLDGLVGVMSGNLLFFENTGTTIAPAFAAAVTNPFGLERVNNDATPDLADIDGDGDLDALVGDFNGDLVLFENTGTASAPAFAAPVANPFGLAPVDNRSAPELADIDGDGDLDALVGDETGATLYFENTGSAVAPAFAAPVTNPFGLTDVGAHGAPFLADIDDDGDLDAFIGEEDGTTIFFENTGVPNAPAFAAGVADPFGLIDLGSFSHPALGDIDGDDDLDGFFGETAGVTIFLRNTGTAASPAFAAPDRNPFRLPAVNFGLTLALGDLDDDGDLDGIFIDSMGNFFHAENTGGLGTPSLAAPVADPFGLASSPGLQSPELGDIDGDGDLDVFAGDGLGRTIFFENTGTPAAPAFAAPATNPFGLVGVNNFASPALADIDGDGDLDALIGEESGNTLFFENTGTAMAPAFAAPVVDPFDLARVDENSSPDLVDIDGDGDLDAFLGARDGKTTFFVNAGTPSEPSFAAPGIDPFGLTDVGAFSSPELADLDDDGDLDMFVGGGSRIVFFENTPVDLGCPPAPDLGCTGGFAGGFLQIKEDKPGKEKLTLKLERGPGFSHVLFGSPFSSGATSYELCLYDDADALAGLLTIDRAGHVCGRRPCWMRPGIPPGITPPLGNGILLYKDKEASADGVTQITLKARDPDKSSISLVAANKASRGQDDLPTGLAAALSATTSVTVQLHASDAGCFATTFDDFSRQDAQSLRVR